MNKLTTSLRACLLNLEAHHGRVDGWRPSSAASPYMYFLYLKAGEIIARDIELAPSTWNQQRTVGGFLRAAATKLHDERQVVSLLMPRDFVGVAVICEGWSLSPEEDADFERIAKSRRVHLHPNRRECRIVLGTLLTSSTVHSITRYRRRNQIVLCPDDEHGGSLMGGIPEGMRHMADVMLDVAATKPSPDAYRQLRELVKRSPKLAERFPELGL